MERQGLVKPRVLSVGVDLSLLKTRQALLASRGYDSAIATPDDVDEVLAQAPFELAVLSVMLGDVQRERIESKLPPGTRVLRLTYLVQPDELFEMVKAALR